MIKAILKQLAGRPFIAVFFLVLGIAVTSNHLTGKPVFIGEVYNLNDPASVQQLSYSYPETAEGVLQEFPQDGSGRAIIYVSTWPDEESE